MKILYYMPYDDSYMSQWQFFQIFDELSHYDITFELFNPWHYDSYEEANEALLKNVRTEKSIDLFMSCVSSKMLFPSTMREIHRLPIPKLLICYDNLHAPFMHKEIAKYFDLVWLTSLETETMFNKWGCNTIFQPYASNPFAFSDLYEKNIGKVGFVGTPYGTRSMMFNILTEGGIDVDVFCKPNYASNKAFHIHKADPIGIKDMAVSIAQHLSFPIGRKVLYSKIKKTIRPIPVLADSEHLTLKEKLSNEDMNKAYSNYALSFNIITLRNTAVLKHPIQKLHLRTFEIPMCGGLELVEYNEELAGYFAEDEIVFYKDKDEMIDKARYYTNPKNENLVRNMKLKARKRAETEHSWMRRFSVAFDALGLKYSNTADIK